LRTVTGNYDHKYFLIQVSATNEASSFMKWEKKNAMLFADCD